MDVSCGCPEYFPDWDKKELDLSGQAVHEQKIPTLLHMPLAYEHYNKQQQHAIMALGLEETWPRFSLTQTGFWGGRILRLINHASSPSHQVKRLPSPFTVYALLHHGGIGSIKPTLRTLQQTLLDSGKLPKELYLCYLTCPQCSAKKGGEMLLLLRRWVTSNRLKARLQIKS